MKNSVVEILEDSKVINGPSRKMLEQVLKRLPQEVLMFLSGRIIVTDAPRPSAYGHMFTTRLNFSKRPARFVVVLDVQGLREKKAKYVIAHELAHAYLKKDERDTQRSREREKSIHIYSEGEADALAESWGFVEPKHGVYYKAIKIQKSNDAKILEHIKNHSRPYLKNRRKANIVTKAKQEVS